MYKNRESSIKTIGQECPSKQKKSSPAVGRIVIEGDR